MGQAAPAAALRAVYRTHIALALSASLLGTVRDASSPAQALSGDQESACGAIMCLVGGSGVAECAPYLARYFAITAPNPTELFDRRLDFLNLSPQVICQATCVR